MKGWKGKSTTGEGAARGGSGLCLELVKALHGNYMRGSVGVAGG